MNSLTSSIKMKRFIPLTFRICISLVLITFFVVGANAQVVQKGKVLEYKGKEVKTPLAGAELDIRNASSTVSGKDGSFALRFNTQKAGDQVIVRSVRKSNYEIFNKDAVDQWIISPTKQFSVVMCKADKLRELKEKYNSTLYSSYRNQRRKSLDEVERLRKEGKIKDAEYRRKLNQIEDEYDKQLSNINSYIERIVRIDISELNEGEKEIIELIEEGKLAEAISRYEKMDLLNSYMAEHTDRRKLESDITSLNVLYNEKIANEDSIKSKLKRQVDLLRLSGGYDNYKRAAEILCSVADKDCRDISWLLDTGRHLESFMSDLSSANSHYMHALSVCQDDGENGENLAKVYMAIGFNLHNQGRYHEALEHYNKALTIRESIYEEDNPLLANTYRHVASAYFTLGQLDEVVKFYSKAMNILLNSDAKSFTDLASCYRLMAGFYYKFGNYDKAIEFTTKSLDCVNRMDGYKNIKIAQNLTDLADIYLKKGDNEKALDYFQKALDLYTNEYGDSHLKIAYIYQQMAEPLSAGLNKYEDAFNCLEKVYNIRLRILGEDHQHTKLARIRLSSFKQTMSQYFKQDN